MYKAIFVNFDDCLVLHIDPKVTKIYKKSERAKYLFLPLEDAEKIYEHSIINQDVVDYINNAREKDTKVFLLTEGTSKMTEIKKYFLEKRLNGVIDEYISTSKEDIPKSLVIEAYIKRHHISRDKVLYIDDSRESIDMIRKHDMGIDVLNPQTICYSAHIDFTKKEEEGTNGK